MCICVYLQTYLDMCDPCSVAQNLYLLHSKVLHNIGKTSMSMLF